MILVWAMLAIPAPTEAVGSSFDLECVGESWDSPKLLAPIENKRPFSITYRVSLSQSRWCSGECVETTPIEEVTAGRIVFDLSDKDGPFETFTLVRRDSGRYMHRTRLGEFTSISQGECQRRPFSGFPATRF